MFDAFYSFIFSFQFCNFLFVMAAFVYLIATKVVPTLQSAVREKQQSFDVLEAEAKKTKQECQEVARHTQEQALYAQEILEKMRTWKQSIAQHNEQKEAKQGELFDRIESYFEKQQQVLLADTLKKELLPRVMQESAQSLQKAFASEDKQKQFLDAACKALGKESA